MMMTMTAMFDSTFETFHGQLVPQMFSYTSCTCRIHLQNHGRGCYFADKPLRQCSLLAGHVGTKTSNLLMQYEVDRRGSKNEVSQDHGFQYWYYKSLVLDDWGYPYFRKPTYESLCHLFGWSGRSSLEVPLPQTVRNEEKAAPIKISRSFSIPTLDSLNTTNSKTINLLQIYCWALWCHSQQP